MKSNGCEGSISDSVSSYLYELCTSGKTGISGATREIKEGAKQLGETAKEMREGFKDIREIIKQELGNFSNLTNTTVVTLLKLFNDTVLPEFMNSLYLTNMVLKELCVVMMLLGAFLCRLIINSLSLQQPREYPAASQFQHVIGVLQKGVCYVFYIALLLLGLYFAVKVLSELEISQEHPMIWWLLLVLTLIQCFAMLCSA